MDTATKVRVDWKNVQSTIIGLTADEASRKKQIEALGGSVSFDDRTAIETGLNPEKGTIKLKVSVNGKSQTLYVYQQTLKAILENADEVGKCFSRTVGN